MCHVCVVCCWSALCFLPYFEVFSALLGFAMFVMTSMTRVALRRRPISCQPLRVHTDCQALPAVALSAKACRTSYGFAAVALAQVESSNVPSAPKGWLILTYRAAGQRTDVRQPQGQAPLNVRKGAAMRLLVTSLLRGM